MKNRMTFDLDGEDVQSILTVQAKPDGAIFEFIVDRPYLKDRINKAATVLNRNEAFSFELTKYDVRVLLDLLNRNVEVDFSDVEDIW